MESVKPGSQMRNKKSWVTEAIPVLTDWPAYESHKLLEPDRVKLTSSIWGRQACTQMGLDAQL